MIKVNIYYLGENTDYYNEQLDIITLDTKIRIFDNNHFFLNELLVEFDYLIIGNTKNINDLHKLEILLDDNIIVTNCFLQSSLDHIFALNESENINNQLHKIANFILNIDF